MNSVMKNFLILVLSLFCAVIFLLTVALVRWAYSLTSANDPVPVFLLVAVAVFLAGVLHFSATVFLYPKAGAPLQVLGGLRLGKLSLLSGKTAPWPFAKLVGDPETLRIYHPWGCATWAAKENVHLSIDKRYAWCGAIGMRFGGGQNVDEVTFFLSPWQITRVAVQLRKLGYIVQINERG
jgi:hypothetical protein